MTLKFDKKGRIVLSETQIKRQIKNYLKQNNIFFWWNFQTLGSCAGIPDISGLTDDGRPFFIEVKAGDRGVLSEAQARFLFEAQKRKAPCYVARDFEGFCDWWNLYCERK